jgi:hypothetical protein
MIKCADDEGNVDTSDQTAISVRVEHRYLNGPALEKLYRELGLAGNVSTSGLPCLAPHVGCPLVHQSSLVSSLWDDIWWSCNCCAKKNTCPSNKDYAKLGGTIYSTFAVDQIEGHVGDVVSLDDLATSRNLMGQYFLSESANEESFTLTSEEQVIVLYYEYGPTEEEEEITPENPQWMTLAQIEEKGLAHYVEFFYGTKTFVYPTMQENTKVSMKVTLDSLVCGPVNRMTEEGNVIATMGDYIPFTTVDDDVAPLYTDSKNNILATSDSDIIGSYKGTVLTMDEQCLQLASSDSSEVSKTKLYQGNYVKMRAVEGDRIGITIVMDSAYRLDISMMKLFNYHLDMEMVSADVVNDSKRTCSMLVEVPKGDSVIQLCVVDAKFAMDVATFRPIDYLTSWDNDAVCWMTHSVIAMNGTREVQVNQPYAPRKWSAALIHDKTPSYEEDCPTSDYINRPYFDLLGYTDSSYDRYRFSSDMAVEEPYHFTYPYALRFTSTGEDATKNTYWAMWRINHNMVDLAVRAKLAELGATPSEETSGIRVTDTYEYKVLNTQYTVPLENTFPVQHWNWSMEYDPANGSKVLTQISALFEEWGLDQFNFKAFALPSADFSLTLHGNFGENEDSDHTPYGDLYWLNEEGKSVKVALSESEITDFSELTLGSSDKILLVVYPKNFGGLRVQDQPFVAYQLDLVQTPHTIDLQLYMDGRYMTDDSQVMLRSYREYELKDVFPEDVGQVAFQYKNGEMILYGDKAENYVLDLVWAVSYRQRVTLTYLFNTERECEEQNWLVTYEGSHQIKVEAPEGYSVRYINVICPEDEERVTRIYKTEMGERWSWPGDLHRHDVECHLCQEEDGSFTINLWRISDNIEIEVMMVEGDDGTVEGCSRCKNYVDLAPYDYIDWYPICQNYQGS